MASEDGCVTDAMRGVPSDKRPASAPVPHCHICHSTQVIDAIAEYEGEPVHLCADCHDTVTFLHGEWTELPPQMVEMAPDFSVQVRTFRRGRITALMSLEPFLPGGTNGLHLSISHPERHPTFPEIRATVDHLTPKGKVFNYFIQADDPQDGMMINLWEVPTSRLAVVR